MLIKVDKVCVNTFAACIASKTIDWFVIILDYFARALCIVKLLSQAIFNKAIVNLTALYVLLPAAYLCGSWLLQ